MQLIKRLNWHYLDIFNVRMMLAKSALSSIIYSSPLSQSTKFLSFFHVFPVFSHNHLRLKFSINFNSVEAVSVSVGENLFPSTTFCPANSPPPLRCFWFSRRHEMYKAAVKNAVFVVCQGVEFVFTTGRVTAPTSVHHIQRVRRGVYAQWLYTRSYNHSDDIHWSSDEPLCSHSEQRHLNVSWFVMVRPATAKRTPLEVRGPSYSNFCGARVWLNRR